MKKVRKRKMRPLKVGLSRPKGKNKIDLNKISEENKIKIELKKESDSESDEINVSRETIDDICSLHLKRTSNFNSPLKESLNIGIAKITLENQTKASNAAKLYDIKKEFEPVAGPSNVNQNEELMNISHTDHNYDSSPEIDVGIQSFYDKSKLFDLSIEESHKNESPEIESQSILEYKPKMAEINYKRNSLTDLASRYKRKNLKIKIFTPKIKPPTREYILSTLQKYSIPKTRNPEPFYSDYKDVGDKVEIGQMVLRLTSKSPRDLKPFERVLDTTSIEEWRQLLFLQTHEMTEEVSNPDALRLLLSSNRRCVLRPLKSPPTRREVIKWLEDRQNFSKDDVLIGDNAEEICVNIDELESSQAIGLNELNNTISLESTEKVGLKLR